MRKSLEEAGVGVSPRGNTRADRRNRLFEGLGTLSRNDLVRPSRFLDPRHSSGPVCLPWVEIPPFVDRANMARIINAHLDASTLKPTRPDKAIVPPYRRHMSYNLAEAAGVWFHIVFFGIFSLRSRSNVPSRLNGEPSFVLRL